MNAWIKDALTCMFVFVVLIVAVNVASSYAVINAPTVTVSQSDLVTCADGTAAVKRCAPGNEPGPTADIFLAFSDLISGPDTGIGDGSGSGVAVTIWGQGLGSTQGSATVEYCDSGLTCRPAHVYYWKDADGQLPGGPANLHESHGMQEIALSIPDSAAGAGYIRVTRDSVYTTLPFTVRSGAIYHVTASGSDGSGDGSYNNPWATWGHAEDQAGAGSTVYLHTMTLGSPTTDKPLHFSNTSATSGLANQYTALSYPGTRTTVIGHRGTSNYLTEGFSVAKLAIYAAAHDLGANDQPANGRANVSMGVTGSRNGRVVGNYITDEHPTDSNGACASGSNGAIKANNLNANEVGNLKMLGNLIHEYGCAGSSDKHHTTYLSNRSNGRTPNDMQSIAPEFAYNYLKDNAAKNGFHYYDETGDCGDYVGTFKIHNNVIVNQGGAGIGVHASCTETGDFLIENNVLVNTGLRSNYDPTQSTPYLKQTNPGISITGSGFLGSITVKNNTIYKWNDDDNPEDSQACFGFRDNENIAAPASFTIVDNVCWTDKDKDFVGVNYNGSVPTALLTFEGNALYTSVSTPTNAVNPAFAVNSILTDPLLTLTGSKISVGSGSPVSDQSTTSLPRDIYGVTRNASSNIGAVQ